jgi:hypothetical protein
MSLRDYFAAKFLQGMASDGAVLMASHEEEIRDSIAKKCYSIADAMLKARQA